MARIIIVIITVSSKAVRRNDINWKDEKVRLTKESGTISEIKGKDRCRYT